MVAFPVSGTEQPFNPVQTSAEVAIAYAVRQITLMQPSNKEVAIDYLDTEIGSRGVSDLLKTVKNALKQDASATFEFNVIALEIDPVSQTVKLTQDWDACQPETFSASEFVDLVETSRRRNKG